MRCRRWVPRVLLAGVAVGLIGAAPTERPEYHEARRISAQIVQDTLALLVKELGARGPAGAIEACSAVALDLAMKHEQAGWRVRRVSRKVRNPADTPDAYEAGILERFEALKATGGLGPDTEHVELVEAAGKTSLRYLRPIVIANPVCLTCHGRPEDLAPEVRARLEALYPRDQATGYRLGDLRGAVTVTIPVTGAR